MSNTSSPYPGSGYASPIPSNRSTPSLSSKPNSSNVKPPPKPINVFTNDGSFLERFERNKKEDEEKKKESEALKRKKNFDNRFKNRGKRPPPDITPSSDSILDVHLAKKPKPDQPITAYEKQLKAYARPSLKDTGTGIRPMVK